jgi:hypothetical protein
MFFLKREPPPKLPKIGLNDNVIAKRFGKEEEGHRVSKNSSSHSFDESGTGSLRQRSLAFQPEILPRIFCFRSSKAALLFPWKKRGSPRCFTLGVNTTKIENIEDGGDDGAGGCSF